MKQILATGVIRSPHGLKGFVKVHSYSDDTSHFSDLTEVTLEKNGKQRKEEIENLKTNMELEIFAHGALCYSYSGQCLMSSFKGGRSGRT